MIEFLQMNIDYESIRYERLLLEYPFDSKVCKKKRSQLRSLKKQLLKLSPKVIKLNVEAVQETELDLFYDNILKYGVY